MAARPSPKVVKLQKALDAEKRAHENTRDELKTTQQTRDAFAQRCSQHDADNNTRAATVSEIAVLTDTVQRQCAEIDYLRDTASRIFRGGVQIDNVRRV